MSLDLFKRAEIIFWDFDGVIKESVGVKSDAYEKLFAAAKKRGHLPG